MNLLKKGNAISLMILAFIMVTSMAVAQQGNGRGNGNGNGNGNGMMNKQSQNRGERMLNRIPDITETQKTQITKIYTENMKQMLPLRNELSEIMAHKRTLCTTSEADIKEINKQIDKQIEVKSKMMKLRAKTHQDIRNVLTEDQRVFFDTHKQMGRKGHGNHKGHGNRRGGQM